jgi:5-formyltetrahydrofolate cyclo-ligase
MTDHEVRARVLQNRLQWPNALRKEASKFASQHLMAMEEWVNAKTIFCFLSFGDEIDTTPLVEAAWKAGKRVVVPRCHKGFRIEAYEIKNLEGLIPGRYGIREPNPEVHPVIDPTEIDFIVMPGSVFDDFGNRMGYGAGFYDRYLLRTKSQTPRVAFALQLQWVPQLHPQAHDQPVDYLVTESGVSCFKNKNGRWSE